ncbi:unnamed protein product, partial [Didymodactylos carnosus]
NSNGSQVSASTLGRPTLPLGLPLSSSDQYYRQSKIDEENRRLKKKMKTKTTSQDSTDVILDSKTKKSKKSKKQSKQNATVDNENENDDDLYPEIQVKRGGELPEGVQENEIDLEDDTNETKLPKNDPHRALNINLEDIVKPTQQQQQQQLSSAQVTTSPSPLKEELHKKKKKDRKKSTQSEDTNPTVPSKQRTRGKHK